MSELINELIELNKVAKEDEEEIVAYSLDKIKKLALDNTSKEILTKYGIPKFLSLDMTFFTESEGGFEKFGDFIKRQLMEGEVLPELEIFENCNLFGMCNNWYLVLNKDGKVLYVNSENFDITYANKDFITFLTILIRYNTIINEYFEENPEGDFWEEVIDENWIEEFENYIRDLDYQAVDNDTFWDEVLAITINMA